VAVAVAVAVAVVVVVVTIWQPDDTAKHMAAFPPTLTVAIQTASALHIVEIDITHLQLELLH